MRGRYAEEAIDRCTPSAVDRYRREASMIEDYDRSMYILYHRSMSRRGTHDLVPADFKPKASQNYKITPDENLHVSSILDHHVLNLICHGEPLPLDCLGWDSEGLNLLAGDCNSLSNARLLTPHSLLFQVTSSELVEAEDWVTDLIKRMEMALVRCLDTIGALCREKDLFLCTMANRGTGDDGRGRIWGEGMDWTCGGLGYRSDQEDGNGISEMFGHDRTPLQRTRSFPVYGNRTRVREDSLASIGPSHETTMIRNFMYGLKSELGSRLAGSNYSSLSELVEKAVNVETVLEAERKTIPHSGGHTKFSQGERLNFKGHYASSCPNKPIPSIPLAIQAPPSRPAIEPAPKKQNLGGRVYALGVENPDNAGPSSGPITGDDGRGRIWGEGMDWTGGGLGYRSDQEDGNGISEMFGHDRSPLQRKRSFPVYGNRTRVREDSLASIGPSRNWDRRHQHDQSAQSNPRPDQNRATEGPQDQGAENTLKFLHDVMTEALVNQGRHEATMIRNFMYGLEPELGSCLVGSNFSSLSELVEKAANVETVLEAERKTIPHSGGHTKFSQGEKPNFNKDPRFNKGKGRGFGDQANNRGSSGVARLEILD
ncbi:hypothetical protein F2Q70_00025983 [Brassica cretica]|uniref:Uncharacterized protein n=1 Tax=Brassica cretica TaxID=69181 RepID=A0A8S9L1A8_BRACR|nr:hypothetical protein F2Q70_00025983 [Brassica cretica]